MGGLAPMLVTLALVGGGAYIVHTIQEGAKAEVRAEVAQQNEAVRAEETRNRQEFREAQAETVRRIREIERQSKQETEEEEEGQPCSQDCACSVQF